MAADGAARALPAGARHVAVERGALPGAAAEARGQGCELGRVELLAVDAAGCARDRFVHERAAEVIGPGLKAQRRPLRPHLHPRGLDVGDVRMQGEARDCVHEERFAQRRTGAGDALAPQRRLHVHERQRHELGEAVRLALQVADGDQVARPVLDPLHVPEHDRRGAAQADRVRLRA